MGYVKDFESLAKQADVSDQQFGIINNRFLSVLQDVTVRYWILTIAYYTMTNYVTAANILVSALVGNAALSNSTVGGLGCITNNNIIWACWSLSLSAAIINKMIYTLGIIEHKVSYTKMKYALQSEGYKFLAGIQEYGDRTIAFSLFCQKVEQVIQENAVIQVVAQKTDFGQLAGAGKNGNNSDSDTSISV